MLWVHVPYSKHKNEITSIENVIVKENNYSNVKYFDRYNSDKSYYIIRATKGKKQQYAVFDEKYKLIKSYSGDVVINKYVLTHLKKNINRSQVKFQLVMKMKSLSIV